MFDDEERGGETAEGAGEEETVEDAEEEDCPPAGRAAGAAEVACTAPRPLDPRIAAAPKVSISRCCEEERCPERSLFSLRQESSRAFLEDDPALLEPEEGASIEVVSVESFSREAEIPKRPATSSRVPSKAESPSNNQEGCSPTGFKGKACKSCCCWDSEPYLPFELLRVSLAPRALRLFPSRSLLAPRV